MAAFTFAYDLTGQAPIIKRYPVKNAVVLSKGEMCNLESGEVDTAAAADTALLGIACEDVDNTADGLYVNVITNENAVYSCVDANARTEGDLLDLASGAQGVTTASSNTLIVVQTKAAATDRTLVTFNATHYLD